MSEIKSRWRSSAPYVVLGLVVAAAAVLWFAIPRSQKEAAAPLVFPVETVRPQIGSIERSLTVDSYVQSDSVVTVLPKVPGAIVSLSADVGTHLRPGQVIATIDPEPYRLTVNQAQAARSAAESVYERVRKLHDSGAASQQSFDQAQAQYNDATSQLALAQLKLTYTTITSPVDGTVILRHVSPGALVAETVPIVTISNGRSLVVRAEIPEMNALAFQKRRATMNIRARIPALGDATFPLRIRTMAPAINVLSRTFDVQCEFQGAADGILPGMSAQVTFVLDAHRDVPYLPFTALVGGNQLWYVSSTHGAARLSFAPDFSNDSYFELPREYAGYTFILAGQHFLAEGSPVKAVAADPTTGALQ